MSTVSEAIKFLTEEQAAEYLQLKPNQLETERRKGRITPLRIVGNRVRYTYQILNDYVHNHPLNQKSSQEAVAVK